MSSAKKPEGAVSIIFSILLLILFGFAAIAVDLGYMAVAKSELQNSADAGARAGALRLYTNGTGPNWANAQQRAEELAELNSSTGNPVTLMSSPEIGYWNLDTRGQTIQSPIGFTPTAKDLPAVKVIASRTGAGDGGPISTLFARTLDIDSAPSSATAIAVVSGPGYVDQRSLFPFVMSQCMYDAYWDAASTPPGPILQDGEAKIFTIGGNQIIPPCGRNTGTWTSLKSNETNPSYVGRIIKNLSLGNVELAPDPIKIGELIYVLTGTDAVLYKETRNCLQLSATPCQLVTVAVVSDASTGGPDEIGPSKQTDVLAFACLKILGSNQGAKTMTVQMAEACDPPGSGGIGPDYGFKPRPRIVQ